MKPWKAGPDKSIPKPKPEHCVGVVVGRFQIDTFHQGHLSLLDSVVAKHPAAAILLGVAQRADRENPLDYRTRAITLQARYPAALIAPIFDVPGDDVAWCSALDEFIERMYPSWEAVLYGGRGSFLSIYRKHSDIHESRELDFNLDTSASEFRRQVAQRPIDSPDFRAGVIYAMHQFEGGAQ